MSTLTNKYGFIKPEKTDPADITSTNENWDRLDKALTEHEHDLSMSGHKITNVGEPKSRSDVATRGFVEDFSIEGSTYVAVDENNDGNVVLRPFIPDIDNPVDYIVEQGTSGIWTYRKYHSGVVECWGEQSIVIPKWGLASEGKLYTALGEDDKAIAIPSVNFPFEFIEEPKVLVFARNHGWVRASGSVSNSKVAIPEYSIFREQSSNYKNVTVNIIYHANGKWK